LETLADAKGEIRDVLLSWGQRAKENERWGDAADLLSAYQRLKGTDESVLSLLADIREKAHTEQLASLRAQAERMERLGEYDEAIFALNKYLSLTPQDAAQVSERIKQLKAARKQAQLRGGRADAKPFWKRPLVWVGFAVVAVFSLLLFIPNSPLRAALAPEQEVVERIVVATQVPTEMPLPYQWSRINSAQFLERDEITDLAIHPDDRDVLYAGTDRSGIYKTINGGISWQPAFEGINSGQVSSLAIDPQDPDVLYASIGLSDVYKTEDGAQTWHPVNNGINNLGGWDEFSKVLMDPIDHTHLYYSNGFNLFESANAGDSWNFLGGMENQSCPGDYIDLVIDPSSRFLFTATYDYRPGGCDAGVHRSIDGGKNWDLLLNAPIDWNGLFMNPDHGEKIYAMTHGDLQILYGSSDSGETWEILCTGNDFLCRPIGVDENGEIIIFSNNKLLRSKNGTSQWETLLQPFNFTEPRRPGFIVFNPHEADSWYFGSRYLGFAQKGGKTTSDISSGLGAGSFNVYIDKKDDAVMYIETRHNEIYRSIDRGISLDKLEIYADFGGQSRIFLNNSGGITGYTVEENVLLVSESGVDWEETYTLNLPETDMEYYFISHPVNPDLLFFVSIGSPDQLYHSSDKGITWHESINEYKENSPFFHFSEINQDRIYIVTISSVILTEDRGKTWKKCADLHATWNADSPTNAAVHPNNEDWLIVATQGRGIYTLEYNCVTPIFRNQGLKSLFVNSIVIDPNNPEIIYAGTDGGAFISLNGGEEWREINGGLLGANLVFSLAVDSQSNVYASTPYGIFILDEK